MEVGGCGRLPDMGEGEGHEFSLGCAEFELPLRHLSEGTEQTVVYMGLEPSPELRQRAVGILVYKAFKVKGMGKVLNMEKRAED